MAALARSVAAEAVGTAILLAAVVGSGIMGDRLSGGNTAIALLANSLATGGILVALILALGPVSGAHFNPIVTLSVAGTALSWRSVPLYLLAQIGGAVAGVWLAHAMFGLPVLELGTHVRTGFGQWLAEAVATFGLLLVIHATIRHSPTATPFAVGAYIMGAYWFTASTSFANPAVTLARALTNSFSGIRPADAPGFIVAQLAGGGAAILLTRWFAAVGTPAAAREAPLTRRAVDAV
jgi:glycerol uptake facilitator-like aquaporin